MTLEKPRATDYKIKGAHVKSIFNEKFAQILEAKFPSVKFEHACFNLMEKKEDSDKELVGDKLIIGHMTPEEEKEKIISIGARKPDGCSKLLKVIKEFFSDEE